MTYAHYVDKEDTLLSLMTGIGNDVEGVICKQIVGVDICQQYLDNYKRKDVKLVLSDSVEYIKTLPDKSFDVIFCIDGLEHLTREQGLSLIKEMDRVARKRIVIYTPETLTTPDHITYNKPHHAWGIEGGDKYQEHLSGWTQEELKSFGYGIEGDERWQNAYTGEPYTAILAVKNL